MLLAGEVYSVPVSPDRDLRVPNLDRPIVVDGRSVDWDQAGVTPSVEKAPPIEGEPPFSFRYRIGRHGSFVYVLFEVEDDRVVLRDPERPDAALSDQIRLAVVTADDEFLRFAIDAPGDGPASAWLVTGRSASVSVRSPNTFWAAAGPDVLPIGRVRSVACAWPTTACLAFASQPRTTT